MVKLILLLALSSTVFALNGKTAVKSSKRARGFGDQSDLNQSQNYNVGPRKLLLLQF